MSTERIRVLENLLDRVASRARELRMPMVTHPLVVDDDRDGIDINLLDEFPSSSALPVADAHDGMMFDDLRGESASRLIASERPLALSEPPPRHTPPPESGPLRTSASEPSAGIETQADLSALGIEFRVEVHGSLEKTTFLNVLEAALRLKL